MAQWTPEQWGVFLTLIITFITALLNILKLAGVIKNRGVAENNAQTAQTLEVARDTSAVVKGK